ncbi:MAG: hypothetical protein ACPHID_03065 [Thermoplasmatota archaeon]
MSDGSWTLDDAVAAERSQQVKPQREPIEFAFSWSRGATEVAIGAGLVLVGAILFAIASAATWGTVAAEGATLSIRLEDVRLDFGAQGGGLDWSHELFDDFNGIGQVRMAGTLFTVGLISTFVAAGILGTSAVVRGMHVTTLAGILGAVAWVLMLVAALLFPSGAESVWDDASSVAFDQDIPQDIQWAAGRIVAWIGVVVAGMGLVAGFVAIRHADVS